MPIENRGIEEALFDYMVQSVEKTPYYQLLGIELQVVDRGYAEITTMIEQKHTNPLGIIHGGLIMSVADAAMGNAIRSLGFKGVTVDFSHAFPGSAKLGSRIVAKGKVISYGNKMIFAEAEVYAEDKLVGHSKGTFYKIGMVDL